MNLIYSGVADASNMFRAPEPIEVNFEKQLLKTNILLEAICLQMATRPLFIFRLPFLLMKSRKGLASQITADVGLDLAKLPINEDIAEFLREQRSEGRRILLSSALNADQVQSVMQNLGITDRFDAKDDVSATSGDWIEKTTTQIAGEFDVDAGNDPDPRSSHRWAALLNRSSSRSARDYLKAMRIPQWSKNLLIFLPALAAHLLAAPEAVKLVLGFFAFGFVASSIYVFNDLLDLAADRDHPAKRFRPFASGKVPISHGLIMFAILLPLGFGVACFVSSSFVSVLCLYGAVTMLYSMMLKRIAVLDVFTLSGLYSLRLFAGAVAVEIQLSLWMLAFSTFLFLSLALVKRFTELHACSSSGGGAPRGRGYLLEDAPLVMMLASASGYASVVVLALYVNSPKVVELYNAPQGLWLVCVMLLYWVTRLLLLTHRGAMHHDPIEFALTDRASLLTAMAIGLIVIGSATL